MINTTQHGVALVDNSSIHSFGILDNPISKLSIPAWLKEWRFEHEYNALFVLHSYLTYTVSNDEPSEDYFASIISPAIRVLELKCRYSRIK